MGVEFTFFDYVDPGGTNVIRKWLDAAPPKVRAKFDKDLLYLEGTPMGRWTRPYVDTLDGECAGVIEIRVPHMRQQYRILACHNHRRPILLVPFIKRDSAVPPNYCQEALTRRDRVLGNPAVYQVEHTYG